MVENFSATCISQNFNIDAVLLETCCVYNITFNSLKKEGIIVFGGGLVSKSFPANADNRKSPLRA